VHAAVGLELRKIPSELRRALQLKAKLLPAALNTSTTYTTSPPKRQGRKERGGKGRR
jgi:hypothetical protein